MPENSCYATFVGMSGLDRDLQSWTRYALETKDVRVALCLDEKDCSYISGQGVLTLDFGPAMAGFIGSGRIIFRGLSVLLPGLIPKDLAMDRSGWAARTDLGPSSRRV